MKYSDALPPSADQLQHKVASLLWEGREIPALNEVRRFVTVVRATPHQRERNGAGLEIEIQDVLPRAFALPNLGSPDGVQAHSVENKWLARLRRHADKNGCPVVRKWQNRLIFAAHIQRFHIDALADLLASWITTDFIKRFVTAVERATVSMAEGDPESNPLGYRDAPWLVVVDSSALLFRNEVLARNWATGVLRATPWHLQRALWSSALPK